jgi:SAM-dependent methyltransferase
MKCRVCDNEMTLYGTYPRSALEVSKLSSVPKASGGVDINLFSCRACGHYQSPYVNADKYYDDYIMTVSHSRKIQELQKGQALCLSSLAPADNCLIEIGCGDGAFLVHAGRHFKRTLGVEPSQPYFEACLEKGLEVINEYLTKELKFDCTFDAFASRQVFEHISDPSSMLSNVREVLNEGGVGLIEVPNAQKMLEKNRYFDLFSDHINYFTPMSLCRLAQRNNFETISVSESFNGDYLEIYLRKKDNVLNLGLKRNLDLSFIVETLGQYASVAFWGAGAKAQAIMTALGDESRVDFVFDSDINKQGKFIINCSTPILLPSTETLHSVDLVMIFAVSYQDEIMNSLKEEFGYHGDVLCLEGEKPCIVRM